MDVLVPTLEGLTMTSYETILKALKGKKRGLTLPELVERTGLNENTARRAIAVMWWHPDFSFDERMARKCRVSGKTRTAYLAAA